LTAASVIHHEDITPLNVPSPRYAPEPEEAPLSDASPQQR
jgi:hypothetical protein